MGIDKPASPWSKGDQYEKELGEEGVRHVREQVHEEAAAAEGLQKLGSDVEHITNSHDKELERRQFDMFWQKLMEIGGSYTHTYQMDKKGMIPVDSDLEVDGPDLLSCAMAASENGLSLDFICSDEYLMEVAKRITDVHPDMSFSFEETGTRDKLTYTVTLATKTK